MAAGSIGLMVLAGVMVVRDAFALPLPAVVVAVMLLVSGAAESLGGNVARELRNPGSARAREFLLLLAVTYVVGVAATPGSLSARLTPGLVHVTLVAAVGIHWLNAARMRGYLRHREAFLDSVAGKGTGEVRQIIRSARGYSLDVFRALQRVRGQVIGPFVVVTIGFIVLWGLQEMPAPGTVVVYVAAALATAAVVFAANLFLEEYGVAASGLTVPRRFERRRLVSAGVVLAAGGVVAGAVSSNTSVLDLELFAALAEWISGWFTGERAVREGGIDFDFMRHFPNPAQAFGAPPEAYEVSRFWRGFAVVFRWTVIGLFGVAVAAFLAAPFFSRQFRRDLRRAGLRTRIRNALVRLLIVLWKSGRYLRFRARLAWRRVFRGGRGRPEGGPLGAGAARPGTAGTRHTPPLRLRRQRSSLRSLYQELVKWADRHGISHGRGETVREFTARLAVSFPEACGEAPEAAEILSQALYARQPLPGDAMGRYRRVVKGIVKVEVDGEESG